MTVRRRQVHAIRNEFARGDIDAGAAIHRIEALGYPDGYAVLIGKVKS